jgi:flagellar hook protein FlgE
MSFQQGLSGLNAAARNLDVIGNNVANANTVGFKGSVAQFADLYANSLQGAGAGQVGIGVKVADIAQQFTQGNITNTNNPLDVAINGSGFFRLNANGETVFSRNGQFKVDKDGFLINTSGYRVTGYEADATGVLNTASATDLRINAGDLTPRTTSGVDATLNLDSRDAVNATPFNINDPTTFTDSTSLAVYDSLGNPHTLSMYFTKTASNTWRINAALDGAQIGAGPVGTATFRSDGSLDTTATPVPLNISVALSNGAASPLTIAVDLSETTQFGSAFGVNALSQDGYASGRLAGFSITGDGVIQGNYTNGESAVLGQIALANFANPQGLTSLGDNTWRQTSESGAPLVGGPGTGSLGVLQSAAVEDANVDLTQELVNMITAQRNYQANAQTIKTQDQVLQTLVNLR